MDVRWTIKVSQETDRELRTYLAHKDMKKGGLSRFVKEAVQEQLFRLAIEEAQERNADVPDDVLEDVVEEAICWAHSGRTCAP